MENCIGHLQMNMSLLKAVLESPWLFIGKQRTMTTLKRKTYSPKINVKIRTECLDDEMFF
jgi:hypothetical protein